MKPPLQWK